MRWGALVLACVVMLVGCTLPVSSAPEGLSVSVFQTRSDYADRALELRVTNGSDATVTVTSATFASTRFVSASSWDRVQNVPAGSSRDLRVVLAGPECAPETLVDEVLLDYVLSDGRAGSARLPLPDSSTIDAINAEDCLVQSVATVAQITAAETLGWTPGTAQPASLDLLASPTGADGFVEIHIALGTVLLGLVDENGRAITEQAVETTIHADSLDTVIPLRLVPNRCDPHAVAEDRRGTYFPLLVETGKGREGRIVVAVSDGVRAELYDFVTDFCGLP